MGLSSELSAYKHVSTKGGVSWTEADLAIKEHFNKRREESSGFLEDLEIGVKQARYVFNAIGAQYLLGQLPQDLVNQSFGNLEHVNVLKRILDASERTANGVGKRVDKNAGVESN